MYRQSLTLLGALLLFFPCNLVPIGAALLNSLQITNIKSDNETTLVVPKIKKALKSLDKQSTLTEKVRKTAEEKTSNSRDKVLRKVSELLMKKKTGSALLANISSTPEDAKLLSEAKRILTETLAALNVDDTAATTETVLSVAGVTLAKEEKAGVAEQEKTTETETVQSKEKKEEKEDEVKKGDSQKTEGGPVEGKAGKESTVEATKQAVESERGQAAPADGGTETGGLPEKTKAGAAESSTLSSASPAEGPAAEGPAAEGSGLVPLSTEDKKFLRKSAPNSTKPAANKTSKAISSASATPPPSSSIKKTKNSTFTTSSKVSSVKVDSKPSSTKASSSTKRSYSSSAKVSSSTSSASYLVPYLRGLGMNNQLQELQSALVISLQLKRTFCLPPFMRFYLSQKGRRTIPFQEILDPSAISKTGGIPVKDVQDCASACASTLDALYNWFPTLPSHRNHNDRVAFARNTNFQVVKQTTNAYNISARWRRPEAFGSLRAVTGGQMCIGVMASILPQPELYNQASKMLRSSPTIMKAAGRLQKETFKGEKYLAVHWRFEQIECQGVGAEVGLGTTKAGTDKAPALTHPHLKVKGQGPICFTVFDRDGKNPFLQLTTQENIIAAINAQKLKYGLRHVFLATDGETKKLIGAIKHATGALQLKDMNKLIQFQDISLRNENVINRLEQELCIQAHSFMGTMVSSWTAAVLDQRNPTVYKEGYWSHLNRPEDAWLDVASCNCKWTTSQP